MEERFKQIVPNSKNWPIVNLTKNKIAFKQDVLDYSIKRLLKKYESEENIYNLIIRVKNTETSALQDDLYVHKNKHKNEAFWRKIETDLNSYENLKDLLVILSDISAHYFDEISGNFSNIHYKLANRCVSYTLSRLLNPIQTSIGLITGIKKTLRNRINIEGDIDKIRNLAKIGTIIAVPTHFSNLDSAVISWVLAAIGLPPFIYGAGINLFTKKFWNYALSKVGTYKVDRSKKNPIYLTVLENYSCTAIQWECNSLFYPHGTRSRTGGIEDHLKKGLLYAALNAQERIYEKNGDSGKKIFLVPVVFNYPFVLEAPLFAKNCLSDLSTNPTNPNDDTDKDHKKSFQIYHKLIRAKNLFTRGSYMSVRFGEPIDVMGYKVDNEGNSHGEENESIDTYNVVSKNLLEKVYKNEDHLKLICKKILEEYNHSTTILPCNLAAYGAFYLIKEKYAHPDIERLVTMKPEEIVIEYESMERIFAKLIDAAISLEKEGKFFIENKIKTEEMPKLMIEAIKNLGVYHRTKPLLFNSEGNVITQNLGILIYYSNRLKNYQNEFEKFIK